MNPTDPLIYVPDFPSVTSVARVEIAAARVFLNAQEEIQNHSSLKMSLYFCTKEGPAILYYPGDATFTATSLVAQTLEYLYSLRDDITALVVCGISKATLAMEDEHIEEVERYIKSGGTIYRRNDASEVLHVSAFCNVDNTCQQFTRIAQIIVSDSSFKIGKAAEGWGAELPLELRALYKRFAMLPGPIPSRIVHSVGAAHCIPAKIPQAEAPQTFSNPQKPHTARTWKRET